MRILVNAYQGTRRAVSLGARAVHLLALVTEPYRCILLPETLDHQRPAVGIDVSTIGADVERLAVGALVRHATAAIDLVASSRRPVYGWKQRVCRAVADHRERLNRAAAAREDRDDAADVRSCRGAVPCTLEEAA